MAKAQINKMVIETPVQVTVTEMKTEEKQTGVRLDLTMAEAETLHVIVGNFLGSTINSPRKYTTRIFTALGEAGVAYEPDHYVVKGYFEFEDFPKVVKGEIPAAAPVAPAAATPDPYIGARVEFVTDRGDRSVKLRRGLKGTILSADDPLGKYTSNTIFKVQLDTTGIASVFPERFKVIEEAAPAVAPVDPLKGEPEDGAGFTGCNTTKPTLKVGDRVRILHSKNSKEAGWDNEWVEEMDEKIGKAGTIREIRAAGVYFNEFGYGYPPSVLELVQAEPAPALPTIFQVGDVVLVNKQLTVVNRGERAKITSLGQTGGYFLSTIGCNTKKGFAQGEDLTLVTAAHPLSNL